MGPMLAPWTLLSGLLVLDQQTWCCLEMYTTTHHHNISTMFSFTMIILATSTHHFNSLAPGRLGCNSKNGIFNLVLLIGMFRPSHDNALRWMPQELTDDQSTLVQVMAWCHQATKHYLSQCWLRSLLPYGVIRPQWVKLENQNHVRSDLPLNFNSLPEVWLVLCYQSHYVNSNNYTHFT